MDSSHAADRVLRQLPAAIVAALFAVLVLVNRPASQVAIGPVFALEVSLMAGVLVRPVRVVRAALRFWPVMAIMALTVGWLASETLSGSVDRLALRRAAAGVYGILPAVLWAYRRELLAPFTRWPGVAAGVVTMATLTLTDVSLTTSSVLVLGLAIAALRAPRVPVRSLQITVSVAAFALLATAVLSPSTSLVRTPFAALVLLLGLSVLRWTIHALRKRLADRAVPIAVLGVALVFVLAMTTTPVRHAAGSIVAAMAGLSNSQALSSIALTLNPDRSRERGDSIGTAATRIDFWSGILAHGVSSVPRFVVGSGHRQSFFRATRPGEEFYDADRLEPHNSFFGVFFRYGVLGVAGLIAAIALVTRATLSVGAGRRHRLWVMESVLVAVVYASFEVVLEVPYGALVFWTLVLVPAAAPASGTAGTADPNTRPQAHRTSVQHAV